MKKDTTTYEHDLWPLPLWKRAMDLFICLVALPFLAVGTLIMSGITALVSPGPVFFRQERIGHGGRRFYLYKFRSMRVNAATSGHQAYLKELMSSCTPMQKLDAKGDSRLIPLGWLLRATGLDELPQVINVLRGEMSLVGPRPCLPYEYEAYEPWQRQRFASRPGLTGLWQVSGKNRTTFDEMIRLDLEYGRTLNPWLDAKIILLTGPALFRQLADTQRARRLSSSSRSSSVYGTNAGRHSVESSP